MRFRRRATVPALGVAIWVAAVALAPGARAQESKSVDAAALKKKARGYEQEGFHPLAYRAWAQLSRQDPKDRAAAYSAARCAYEMRAYGRAKKHVEHALSLGESSAATSLAKKIDAGLTRDARWEALVNDEVLPRLMQLLETGLRDRRKVAELFEKDGTAQTRFRSRHIDLQRTGSTVFLSIRTDSREAAQKMCEHLQTILDKAAKGWAADRAGEVKSLFPRVVFGDAIRRSPPNSRPDPDVFVDVEWAFPVKAGERAKTEEKLANVQGTICRLGYARTKVDPDDDAALRGFAGHRYTVALTFDGKALKPIER